MIEFIEKEPYKDFDKWNWRECLMYPTFMLKDNKEYFILNRRSPQEEWDKKDDKKVLDILKRNDGRYTYFYNRLLEGSPYDFLKEVIKNKYSFEKFSELIEHKERNYCDFHGNLKEISSAFHYRIYDDKMSENIRNVFNLINNKEWTRAETKINECIKEEKKIIELDEECKM